MIIYLTTPTISDRSILVVALVAVTTVVDDFWRLDWDKQHSQQDGRQEDGDKQVIFL